ncbi:hypothetical protein BH10PSE11_BH10PSE11_08330 [soil metagenome]
MSDPIKFIQIAVARLDDGPYGTDVLENYFHEHSIPAISQAMDVTIDGQPYTVWNFINAKAAQTIIDEFNGIDVSTLSEDWRKANAFRLSTQLLGDPL